MSSSNRRPHARALAHAEMFRALFPPETYVRWEFAGSLRRHAADIGDIEHVIEPAFGDVPGSDLFATPTRKNLLFAHADVLVATGALTRHLYANGYRWGDLYRGIDFSPAPGVIVMNEIFCASDDNWGSTLAIRTGPAELSQRLVTGLLRYGFRNKGGKVWECSRCDCGRDEKCKRCDGTGLIADRQICVSTEQTYFKLCGMPFAAPADRGLSVPAGGPRDGRAEG